MPRFRRSLKRTREDAEASDGEPQSSDESSDETDSEVDEPRSLKRNREVAEDSDGEDLSSDETDSEVDEASLSDNSEETSTVDVEPTTPVLSPPPPSLFSEAQHRFCLSTIESLAKNYEAKPFLKPVDYVALMLPKYPKIIKNPMDFSTIRKKLVSSNPTKPDPNPKKPRYSTPDEFIADVRLVVSNCVTFNGPQSYLAQAAKRLEEVFDKEIQNMPPPPESPKTSTGDSPGSSSSSPGAAGAVLPEDEQTEDLTRAISNLGLSPKTTTSDTPGSLTSSSTAVGVVLPEDEQTEDLTRAISNLGL